MIVGSILDKHAIELLRRKRQGYTQKMLLLWLNERYELRITQPALSRWLSTHTIVSERLSTDAEYLHFEHQSTLTCTHRRYNRCLSKYNGHIESLRAQGLTLEQIQSRLLCRYKLNVSTSTISRLLAGL